MLRELRRYPNAQLMWCQEEPLNMGAFHHVSPRIETCMRHEVRLPFSCMVALRCRQRLLAVLRKWAEQTARLREAVGRRACNSRVQP